MQRLIVCKVHTHTQSSKRRALGSVPPLESRWRAAGEPQEAIESANTQTLRTAAAAAAIATNPACSKSESARFPNAARLPSLYRVAC